MAEIFVNNHIGETTNLPDVAIEVSIHPVTKRRGRWLVRTGKPVQVWDKKQNRLKWVRFSEVEPVINPDGGTFVLIGAGEMSRADYQEVRDEATERRDRNRAESPTMAPPPDYIEEACKQVQLKDAEEWRVGSHTFKRAGVKIYVPKDADAADTLAYAAKG